MIWLLGAIVVGAVIVYLLLRPSPPPPPPLPDFGGPRGGGSISSRTYTGPGFSVRTYSSQDESWRLQEDNSSPGHAPGPPPTEKGLYDGQCVKVPSVPKPKVA